MPSRILRDGILSSERVVALSGLAELFYRKLYSIVDDYGRYYAAPGTLRGACWPTAPERVTEAQIEKWLSECQQGEDPLITVYVVKGAKYLQINNFGQQIRSKSKFPDPANNCLQIASTSRSRDSESDTKSETETEPATPSAPLAFPSPKPKPPLEQESDAGIGELRELWAQRAKTLASDQDWVKFERVWWRSRDFHQRRQFLEAARVCEAPWFGTPLSWAEAGGWQRRDNPAVAKSGPRNRQDQIADAFKQIERDIDARFRPEP